MTNFCWLDGSSPITRTQGCLQGMDARKFSFTPSLLWYSLLSPSPGRWWRKALQPYLSFDRPCTTVTESLHNLVQELTCHKISNLTHRMNSVFLYSDRVSGRQPSECNSVHHCSPICLNFLCAAIWRLSGVHIAVMLEMWRCADLAGDSKLYYCTWQQDWLKNCN